MQAGRKRDNIIATLQRLGFSYNENNIDHMAVLLEAMDVFVEREEKYHGLWMQSGAVDNAQNLYSKAQRVRRGMTTPDVNGTNGMEFQDDALDIINYSAFTLRNIRAGLLDEQEQPSEQEQIKRAMDALRDNHEAGHSAHPEICGLCGNYRGSPPGTPCDVCGKFDAQPLGV